ncbi:hypothetical protein RCL1_000960 [Eukaryota sp. TZLM3-RCL]
MRLLLSIFLLLTLSLANDSLFWGTYRPGHYFGVKSQVPDSLNFGLVWFSFSDPRALQNIRHEYTTANVDANIIANYKEHDLHNYAIEEIHDHPYNLNISLSFVKLNSHSEWSLHVVCSPLDPSQPSSPIAILPYVYSPHEIQLSRHSLPNSMVVPVVHLTQSSGDHKLITIAQNAINFDSAVLPKGSENLLTTILANLIAGEGKKEVTGVLSGSKLKENANLFFNQIIFQGSVKFDCLLLKESTGLSNDFLHSRIFESKNLITKYSYSFQSKFNKILSSISDPSIKSTAFSAISNLFGGAGHFYGSSIVSEKTKKGSTSISTTSPYSLFSFTPSRSTFPRPFFWDEGFHLMVVSKLDPMVSARVLNGWISLIGEDGWIPREHVLGSESINRVPAEFRTQYKHVSNPPALLLPVIELSRIILKKKTEFGLTTLTFEDHYELSNLIKSWIKPLNLFLKQFKKNCYKKGNWKWPDRTAAHCLSSGLDDYPRGGTPGDDDCHVDLTSWMCFAWNNLAKISEQVGGEPIIIPKILSNCQSNLIDSFWSEKRSFFGDFAQTQQGTTAILAHHGYVGLFPLMLCHVAPTDHDRIEKIVNIVLDENALNSPAGIRSLSKQSKLFGSGENYWRGPVWINLNYLYLKAIKECYWENDVARQSYHVIRSKIVKNVAQNYINSGFFYEQYNPIDGKGQKNKPFTGWTSLIFNLIIEDF